MKLINPQRPWPSSVKGRHLFLFPGQGLNVGPTVVDTLSHNRWTARKFPHFVFKLFMTTQGYNKQGEKILFVGIFYKNSLLFSYLAFMCLGHSFHTEGNPKPCLSQQWYSFTFPSLLSVVFCQSVVCGPATSTISWEIDRMPNHKSSKSRLSQINTWPASPYWGFFVSEIWLILITNHLSCFFFFSSLALNLLKKSKSSKSQAPQAQH